MSGLDRFISGLDCLISGLDCLISGLDCLVPGLDCLISSLDCLISGLDCLICAMALNAHVGPAVGARFLQVSRTSEKGTTSMICKTFVL